MDSKNIPILKSRRIKVGITLGDPAGIGPEIIYKALKRLRGLADFTVIGDAWVFKRPAGAKFIDLNNVAHKNFKFGKLSADYGRASIEYLDAALELIKNKEINCLVTCPISKEAIKLAHFNWPGHTEYLAQKTHSKNYAMMLLNKKIKFCLLTRHIPLCAVSRQLSADKIRRTIFLAYNCLRKLFLIANPRIVVCGLNPHASDNGVIGNEENRIIKPALKRLKNLLGDIDGPLACDTAILRASEKKYDCVIAAYHDQALIPLKLLDRKTGVNMTLGLPFVRTSPLHGTAFDIAGKGLACADSLVEAIQVAVKCLSNLKKD